jgi:hypothetical protein
MVLSWIAAGVEETCADAIEASASTARKPNLFIGIYLRKILTPSSAKVADPSGMGHLLTYSLCEFRLTRAAFKRRKEPMRRRTAVQMLGTLALMAPTAVSKLWAQGEKKEAKKEAAPELALKVGDMAPDFTLPDQTYKNKVSLHDFKGKKNVALAFYIFAFTGG